MKFKYSEKYLKSKLRFGVLQLGIGIVSLLVDAFGPIFQYGWLFIGIFSLLTYYLDKTKNCLTLENEIITIDCLFKNKLIKISEFDSILKNKNNLALINSSKKEKIQTWFAKKEAQDLLFHEIEKIINKNKQSE